MPKKAAALFIPSCVLYAQAIKTNVLFFDRKPAREVAWMQKLCIYDLRTNKHFTLKRDPLTRADLSEFIKCYLPENCHERTPTWPEENPGKFVLTSLRMTQIYNPCPSVSALKP